MNGWFIFYTSRPIKMAWYQAWTSRSEATPTDRRSGEALEEERRQHAEQIKEWELESLDFTAEAWRLCKVKMAVCNEG